MKRHAAPLPASVELVVAPAAIERALDVFEQLQSHDPSVILQARKILTRHIFGMVDQGELDEQRLTVGGLAHLIVGGLASLEGRRARPWNKVSHVASKKPGKNKASSPMNATKDHP